MSGLFVNSSVILLGDIKSSLKISGLFVNGSVKPCGRFFVHSCIGRLFNRIENDTGDVLVVTISAIHFCLLYGLNFFLVVRCCCLLLVIAVLVWFGLFLCLFQPFLVCLLFFFTMTVKHPVAHIPIFCRFNNNNNNNNRIEMRNSRFFTISSLCRETSPMRTLKWTGHNHVQITCNTSSAYHVQGVVLCATW